MLGVLNFAHLQILWLWVMAPQGQGSFEDIGRFATTTARTSGFQREGKRSVYNRSNFGSFDTLFSYVLLETCKHCLIMLKLNLLFDPFQTLHLQGSQTMERLMYNKLPLGSPDVRHWNQALKDTQEHSRMSDGSSSCVIVVCLVVHFLFLGPLWPRQIKLGEPMSLRFCTRGRWVHLKSCFNV